MTYPLRAGNRPNGEVADETRPHTRCVYRGRCSCRWRPRRAEPVRHRATGPVLTGAAFRAAWVAQHDERLRYKGCQRVRRSPRLRVARERQRTRRLAVRRCVLPGLAAALSSHQRSTSSGAVLPCGSGGTAPKAPQPGRDLAAVRPRFRFGQRGEKSCLDFAAVAACRPTDDTGRPLERFADFDSHRLSRLPLIVASRSLPRDESLHGSKHG